VIAFDAGVDALVKVLRIIRGIEFCCTCIRRTCNLIVARTSSKRGSYNEDGDEAHRLLFWARCGLPQIVGTTVNFGAHRDVTTKIRRQ